MQVEKYKSKKNCENCGGAYVGGKQYGDYYCILPWSDEDGNVFPVSGLCEFCNPNDKKWTTEEIFEEVIKVIKQLQKVK